MIVRSPMKISAAEGGGLYTLNPSREDAFEVASLTIAWSLGSGANRGSGM